MKRSKKGLLGDNMSGRATGGGQGLMASGAMPLGMGAPQYQVNRNNPTMATMTGFGGGMPFAYNKAAPMDAMGPMAFNKSGYAPPPGGYAPPPGFNPPPPSAPPPGGGPSGPSAPGTPMPPQGPVIPGTTPGVDSYTGRPQGPRPFDINNNAWTRSGQNVPQNAQGPMQQGQYGWGWQAQGPAIPSMGAKEKLYISHMLGGNPAWANQVDNNNLLGSIGQLSGVQFDPNSPLWQV